MKKNLRYEKVDIKKDWQEFLKTNKSLLNYPIEKSNKEVIIYDEFETYSISFAKFHPNYANSKRAIFTLLMQDPSAVGFVGESYNVDEFDLKEINLNKIKLDAKDFFQFLVEKYDLKIFDVKYPKTVFSKYRDLKIYFFFRRKISK